MTANQSYRQLVRSAIVIFTTLAFQTVVATSGTPRQIKQTSAFMKQKPHIVFLITEDPDNYEAHKTVPLFAKMLQKEQGYKVTVLLGKGTHGAYRYPHFEVIDKADLLVVFARRIALPHDQMSAIRNYLNKGKPLIGIRTANHAFAVRDKIEDGFEDWPAFVADVLGCENRGYGPVGPGTNVTVVPEAANHPIVKNLPAQWHSNGNVYLVAPLLDTTATVLLTGSVNEEVQPIAWTRSAGNSRVFYTSLGYPDDFNNAAFTHLLINGIQWALKENDH